MRNVGRVGRWMVCMGWGLFFPLYGWSVGSIVVYAYDTSTYSSPPPSSTAILNGGESSLTFDSSGWVIFSGLSAGAHTVEVTVANGYPSRESPTVENAVDDPDSDYGNPRHIVVLNNQAVQETFRFDPAFTAIAVVRDAWTMERLEDADIKFIVNSGPNEDLVYSEYPWEATYADEWCSDSEGEFPENTILYVDPYDLSITNSGYRLFTSNGVVVNATAGDVIDLGEVFLLPVDVNSNRIADAWETAYFGAGSNVVANADADGDGMDNRAEYVAGTDPTNALSLLAVESPLSTTNGLKLTWSTAPWRTYRICGATNLCSTGGWVQVAGTWEATNDQAEMSWVETNMALSWNNSYRVDVVPCTWSETNQVLVKTNGWPTGGSGGGSGAPPVP